MDDIVITTSPVAAAGDAVAQHDLGDAYYFGEGVQKDRARAVQWYAKAAAQGSLEAALGMFDD